MKKIKNLTIGKLYRLRGASYIGSGLAKSAKNDPVQPSRHNTTDKFVYELKPGSTYIFESKETVDVDVEAIVVTSDILSTTGLNISTIYLPEGYTGSVHGVLNLDSSLTIIETDTVIGCVII